jgi:hypothetical protein
VNPIFAYLWIGPYLTDAVQGYTWLNVGSVLQALAGSSWGVAGTQYTITAVTPDPHGNANVPASYPGDSVTLSGGIGVVFASTLVNSYLISQPGGYY